MFDEGGVKQHNSSENNNGFHVVTYLIMLKSSENSLSGDSSYQLSDKFASRLDAGKQREQRGVERGKEGGRWAGILISIYPESVA